WMSRSPAPAAAQSSGNTEGRSPNAPSFTNALARNLSLSTGVTRWLYWMDAVERASLADFPGLARLAVGDHTAIHLIAARWAQLDPKNFFHELVGNDLPGGNGTLGYLLIRDWAKRDPTAMIAAFNEAGSRALPWRTAAAD